MSEMNNNNNNNNHMVDSVHERRSGSEWSHDVSPLSSNRSSDTVNSNIRNMTNHNRPSGDGGKEENNKTRNENNGKENAATDAEAASSSAAPENKIEKQPNIGCSAKNLIGATICAVLVIAWIFYLFLEEGGANLFGNDESATSALHRSWSPPTLDQCASIANGTYLIDGEPQERLLVNLELTLSAALLDEGNVTSLEADWKNKLQQHVMPTLTGCEASSSANRQLVVTRLPRGGGGGKTTSSLRHPQASPRTRILQQLLLPDYIISHAMVGDTILSWNETIPKQKQQQQQQQQMSSDLLAQPTYVYPLAVNVLLWMREEASDVDLLKEKVSQVFSQFLQDENLLTDLQLATSSKLVSVNHQWNSTTTGNQPTPNSTDVVATPVAPPTKSPTTSGGFQTMAPSSAPSSMIVNDDGNVTEPTPSPVTGNVTDSSPTTTPPSPP